MNPVLIVEDETIMRESLRDWLKEEGYEVDTAESGEEALQKIGEREFGVAVLDLRLPGKDGLEVLKEAAAQNPEFKGIIITAYPSVETAVEAMKIGAVSYIVKPFAPDALEKAIAEVLGPVQVEVKPQEGKVEKATAITEEEIPAYLEQGQTYFKAGRYKEALRDFQSILQIAPGHIETRVWIRRAKEELVKPRVEVPEGEGTVEEAVKVNECIWAMKVLVISHSQDLSQVISDILKIRWPDLNLVYTNEIRESLQLIHREQPDIVIFHLPNRSAGVPPLDYFDLISQIRSFSGAGLIVISQSDDVMDKVRALDMGADAWMSFSFVPMEFIAKVNAILRRSSPSDHDVSFFTRGKLSVNHDTRQVYVSGKTAKLTPIQYKLLCHLIKNQGRVCSSTNILEHVWGPNYSDDRELLKLSVYRLRHKIEEDPSHPEIILNERGIGYVFRAPALNR